MAAARVPSVAQLAHNGHTSVLSLAPEKCLRQEPKTWGQRAECEKELIRVPLLLAPAAAPGLSPPLFPLCGPVWPGFVLAWSRVGVVGVLGSGHGLGLGA